MYFFRQFYYEILRFNGVFFMKKFFPYFILFIFASFFGFMSCATSGNMNSENAKNTKLNSCIVNKNYDFIFEIINNTDETIFFSNGVRNYLNTMNETKTFSVKKNESFQIKYKMASIKKSADRKIEDLQFFTFMTSENNKVISGNPKSICIYENDGRYINYRNFYNNDNPPQHVLADRKYILTLSNVENGINVSSKINDLSDFVYDEIIPGDGKSPVKLQLRNSKEYIEVDWQYPRYHANGGGTCGDWQFCETGKDIQLILNYNTNNDFYVISSTAFEWNASHNYKIRESYWDAVRDYTVEELETLIGVKTPRTSADGIEMVK